MAHSTADSSASVRHRWTEFGQWHEDTFCEATDPRGDLESHSSRAYKEYHDRLKAVRLRQEGLEAAEAARRLGRDRDFVERWWRLEPRAVPVPPGVAQWQTRQPETWRDVTIVRGFARGRGIYEEVMAAYGSAIGSGHGHLQWEQDWSIQKLSDGSQALRYNREGKLIPMGCMKAVGGYWGGCPKLDRTLEQFVTQFDVRDRHVAIMLLYYAHGFGGQGPHRHDCASAVMSFGSPRILTIDGRPFLLRDGDLVLFGPQRHGVPIMPDVQDGRVSLAFFYFPKGAQLPKSFSTSVADSSGSDGPSQAVKDLQREAQLGMDAAEEERRRLNSHVVEVDRLAQMGFPRPRCAQVLLACGLDPERAAMALLAEAEARRRLQTRLSQLEGDPAANQAELQAVLLQLQEYEEEDLRCACIEAENEERDLEQEREDAENWDGRGDLMVMTCRQRHLQVDMQPRATVGSVCVRGAATCLLELLRSEGVAVVYDFRSAPDRAAPQLRSAAIQHVCKTHGVIYKRMSLGREGTGGTERHLLSDEGRHALAELVWHCRRRRALYLADGDGGRQQRAIASALERAGHTVHYLDRHSFGCFGTHEDLGDDESLDPETLDASASSEQHVMEAPKEHSSGLSPQSGTATSEVTVSQPAPRPSARLAVESAESSGGTPGPPIADVALTADPPAALPISGQSTSTDAPTASTGQALPGAPGVPTPTAEGHDAHPSGAQCTGMRPNRWSRRAPKS